MHKRYFIVLAAAGVSAAALILAVVFGGQTTGVGESTAPRSPGDVDLPTVPDAAPGGPGSPGGAGGEVSAFTRRVGELEKGEVVFKQEGRRTILNYDELRPEADGVLRVTQPRARIIFSPRRMLEVRSQHGTVIAPEGQLLEGTFRGEVVTTFYEAPEGQTLDIDRSDHVLVRLYLDKAHYDDQIGRLVSDGPVFMTSPSVDAAGVGLSMTFNQLRQRLEQLVIRQGERMIDRLDSGEGVLILTDAFGSTPGNLATRIASDDSTRVVAGVNMPMLLRVFNYHDQPLAALSAAAIEGGRRGIVDCQHPE